MRVIFMGTPDFAVPALDALVELGAEIVGVYTKAPRPAGRRGLGLTISPVHARAKSLGLPIFTPATLRAADAQTEFQDLAAEAGLVAAYGLILPPAILSAPRLGCVNLHGSLLPRWRGAAPIQRAVMAGDAETGVGLMRMEAGLDTGPVAREARVPIRATDTAGDLTKILADLGAGLLRECWADFAADRLLFHPQRTDGIVYAHKIDKSETAIDWSKDARTVRNHIHGLSPAPGAHSETAGAERVKFLRVEVLEADGAPGEVLDDALTVACGQGAVRAIEAQRAGKAPMSGALFMRGGAVRIGETFKSAAVPRSED